MVLFGLELGAWLLGEAAEAAETKTVQESVKALQYIPGDKYRAVSWVFCFARVSPDLACAQNSLKIDCGNANIAFVSSIDRRHHLRSFSAAVRHPYAP